MKTKQEADMINTKKVLQNKRAWAREAGKMQMQCLGKVHCIDTKSSMVDLVTEVDRSSERIILEGIGSSYPEHAILSEEQGRNEMESYQEGMQTRKIQFLRFICRSFV